MYQGRLKFGAVILPLSGDIAGTKFAQCGLGRFQTKCGLGRFYTKCGLGRFFQLGEV
jgi:hypothetical protein